MSAVAARRSELVNGINIAEARRILAESKASGARFDQQLDARDRAAELDDQHPPPPAYSASARTRASKPAGTRWATYGAELAQRIADGALPTNGVWVYATRDRFERAKRDRRYSWPSRGALVVPHGVDPSQIHWPALANLPALLMFDSSLPADDLGVIVPSILAAGAQRCVVLDVEHHRARGYGGAA